MSIAPKKAKKKPHSSKNDLDRIQKHEWINQVALLCGLMIVVAWVILVTHWPALSAKVLSFDDEQYLTRNFLVQNPSWKSAGRFLTEVLEPSTVNGYYQPLSMISLMLDYAIGGRTDNLRTFHRSSLALHVANTALVIVLLYMLFGQPWIAAMVGLLFGVHPMTVEPIAWIGERKTLLATFFALWSLTLYVRYTRTKGWKAYCGCLLMYILALMSKPTSVPLPLLMLLLDYWPLNRLSRQAVIEKIPLVIVGGLSCVITFISQDRTAGTSLPGEYPATRIPLAICHNIIFYLYKIFWPSRLSSHYPFPSPFTPVQPMVLAGIIGTCVLLALLVISLRWTRAFLTGWLFFFIAIFPTMGVVGFTVVIASDKFAYMPSFGLLLVLTWLLSKFWNRPAGKSALAIGRLGTLVVIMIIAASEALTTHRHLAHWQNTERHYRHMITLAPGASILHLNLGNELLTQGRLDEAIEELSLAIELDHTSFMAHNNLANILTQKGKIAEAIRHFQMAMTLKPDFADAYNGMGLALAGQGKADEAIEYYEKALEINPDYPEAHNNLGTVIAQQGKSDQAMAHFCKALEINRNYAEAHNNLAILFIWQGKADEAINSFRESLRIRPLNVGTRCNLAALLRQRGRINEATAEYTEVLRIDPQNVKAVSGLNSIRARGSQSSTPQ